MKTISIRMSDQLYEKIDQLRKSNMYPKHLEEQSDSQIIRDCINISHWEYCLSNKTTNGKEENRTNGFWLDED